jgi:hypothetical protein
VQHARSCCCQDGLLSTCCCCLGDRGLQGGLGSENTAALAGTLGGETTGQLVKNVSATGLQRPSAGLATPTGSGAWVAASVDMLPDPSLHFIISLLYSTLIAPSQTTMHSSDALQMGPGVTADAVKGMGADMVAEIVDVSACSRAPSTCLAAAAACRS